jgi:hypothetical protein
MSRFLVHADDVTGPASHAVVIGVSAYPHLVGGTGPLTQRNERMGQLTSPTQSAREFASWLIRELHDPNKPLASVALLLSEPDEQPFRNPRTGVDHAVQPATIANAKQALREWAARGQTADDRLILYFCGHGLANGTKASLLLADYGADPNDALEGAIDFSNLWLGLEAVAAREQCFFIDACRANAQTTLGANGYMGQPIFTPNIQTLVLPAPPPRRAPIYYSTILGEYAYGRPSLPSPFTEALIRALDGAGSDDNEGEGDWRVNTTGLKRALDFFMERAFQAGAERVQVPAANNLTTFDLHYLRNEPEALVFVGCRPEEATSLASFSSLSRGQVVERRGPGSGEWELRLPPGDYEFVADFADSRYTRASRNRYVLPPYRKVPLEVYR